MLSFELNDILFHVTKVDSVISHGFIGVLFIEQLIKRTNQDATPDCVPNDPKHGAGECVRDTQNYWAQPDDNLKEFQLEDNSYYKEDRGLKP